MDSLGNSLESLPKTVENALNNLVSSANSWEKLENRQAMLGYTMARSDCMDSSENKMRCIRDLSLDTLDLWANSLDSMVNMSLMVNNLAMLDYNLVNNGAKLVNKLCSKGYTRAKSANMRDLLMRQEYNLDLRASMKAMPMENAGNKVTFLLASLDLVTNSETSLKRLIVHLARSWDLLESCH